MELHPQMIEKNGKKEFVILPYDDFSKIQEKLESYDDLRMLREAKEKEGNSSTISLDQVKKELNID